MPAGYLKTLRIIIAVLITLSGSILLWENFVIIRYAFKLAERMNALEEVSWWKVLKIYHLSIISNLLLFIGGLLLIIGKKYGWILSVLATSFHFIQWTSVYFLFNWNDRALIGIGIFFGFMLTFLLILIVAHKQFRFNKSDWIRLLILLAILIIDRFLF